MPCLRCKQPAITLQDGTKVCITCEQVWFGKPVPVKPSLGQRVYAAVPRFNPEQLVFLDKSLTALVVGLLIGLVWFGVGVPLVLWIRGGTVRIPGAIYTSVACSETAQSTDHCAALWLVGDHHFDIHVQPGQCALIVNGRCMIRTATGHVRVESLPASK